ncbi:hypothetical protein [Streptomyces sp. NPDC053367]|uniref:hypothetical protein n=1 Tax=Streptomyces sp. NPDC053367 TaxID=3365700 RepID=UPI0037D988BD
MSRSRRDCWRITDDTEARAAGLPFVTSAELSKQLTAAKKTPERAWLAACRRAWRSEWRDRSGMEKPRPALSP